MRSAEMASSPTARLACLAILFITAVIAAPQVTAAAAAPAIRVSANHIVDANGNVVQLRGVNRSGAEYACAEGWGTWDGPTDDETSTGYMLPWTGHAACTPPTADSCL